MDAICAVYHEHEQTSVRIQLLLDLIVEEGHIEFEALKTLVDSFRIPASAMTTAQLVSALSDKKLCGILEKYKPEHGGRISGNPEYIHAVAETAGLHMEYLSVLRKEHDLHHGVQVSQGSVSPSAN